jgi:hypothetical protein
MPGHQRFNIVAEDLAWQTQSDETNQFNYRKAIYAACKDNIYTMIIQEHLLDIAWVTVAALESYAPY